MSDIAEREDILPWFKTLDGVRKVGGWYVARCPLHDDKLQSLGLSEAGVLKCYAGCSFKDLMALCRKEMPTERREIGLKKNDWVTVAQYQYTTLDGTTTATKYRLEHRTQKRENGKPTKRFRWEVQGGGSPSDHGLTVESFGFWEDANDQPDRRVWITEGEKACEAVRSRNEVAICPPGSASNVPPKAALERLRGRDVIIWRDLDGPGLRWAEGMKKALRYIAKSCRIVVAPGEEGDDAVDFFSGGGLLEDLLAVTRAITERVTPDHYRVTLPTDYGPVVFDADELTHQVSHGKSELNGVFRVTLTLPGTEEESYVERLNLYSSTAKSSFISSLTNQFDGDKKVWTRIVNSAFEQLDREWKAHSRAATFSFDPSRPPREFLIDTLFPLGHHSLLFAPPATGKSYITQEMSLAIALGEPFVTFGSKCGPVLILDYESQKTDWEERWSRLLRGHGFDPEFVEELPVRYMSGGGIPLAEQWRNVKREVEEIGAIALIVDSAMPASGGDMFSTSTAAAYFSALDRIGVTSITIGQVPAADASKLYGNQQWVYAPHGRIWQLEKQQGYGSAGDAMEVAFTCRKASNGRQPEPFAIRVNFDGDHGPVRFERANIRDVEAETRADDAEAIAQWLQIAGPSLRVHELAKETALSTERVVAALKSDERFAEVRSTKNGEPTRWVLRNVG